MCTRYAAGGVAGRPLLLVSIAQFELYSHIHDHAIGRMVIMMLTHHTALVTVLPFRHRLVCVRPAWLQGASAQQIPKRRKSSSSQLDSRAQKRRSEVAAARSSAATGDDFEDDDEFMTTT